jgi:predicted Zn-dependent peptidase
VFSQLRVKEGLAYSPGGGAYMQSDGSAALFFSSLAVNSGVGRTVQFFKHVVERVESGDIDPNEIKLHQLRINRSGGVANQSVMQMSGMLYGAIDSDLTWEQVAAKGDQVADVTADDLQRLVSGCLDHAFISMEGPKDVITEQLDEKGFEYELIDYEKLGADLLWKYDKKSAKKYQKAKDKEEKAEAEAEADGTADGDDTEG